MRRRNMSNRSCIPVHGTLLDSEPGRPFGPFVRCTVTKRLYMTSNDPRGYILVYEYPLRDQWIMMDIDNGYIFWTGIWKALGHSKVDIVKLLDAEPDVAPLIRRIRGGYLKIQGTWMPYEVALRLSRRVAWEIRFDLVPLFGPTFPDTCLFPGQPGYGQMISVGTREPVVSRSSIRSFTTSTYQNFKPQSSDMASCPGQLSCNQHRLPLLSQNKFIQRPAVTLGTRRQDCYIPYSDLGKHCPPASSDSQPTPTLSGLGSRSLNPFHIHTMQQYWPSVRSNVSLPPIKTLDSIHDHRSGDPPSVVLQRLKDDPRDISSI